MSRLIRTEIERWYQTSPETFQGEQWQRWESWVVNIIKEGSKAVGMDENGLGISMIVKPVEEWGLILTQEEYPFYQKPESWALASALSLNIALELMDNDSFVVNSRSNNAKLLQLVAWLIENPRRLPESR